MYMHPVITELFLVSLISTIQNNTEKKNKYSELEVCVCGPARETRGHREHGGDATKGGEMNTSPHRPPPFLDHT